MPRDIARGLHLSRQHGSPPFPHPPPRSLPLKNLLERNSRHIPIIRQVGLLHIYRQARKCRRHRSHGTSWQRLCFHAMVLRLHTKLCWTRSYGRRLFKRLVMKKSTNQASHLASVSLDGPISPSLHILLQLSYLAAGPQLALREAGSGRIERENLHLAIPRAIIGPWPYAST